MRNSNNKNNSKRTSFCKIHGGGGDNEFMGFIDSQKMKKISDKKPRGLGTKIMI